MPQPHTEDRLTFQTMFVVGISAAIAFYAGLYFNHGINRQPLDAVNNTKLTIHHQLNTGHDEYDIVLVTDLDHDSKDGKKWKSIVTRGRITLSPDHTHGSVQFSRNSEYFVNTQIAAGGRAMELSDLAVFDGKLLSIDDRTGMIYQLDGQKAIPWVFVNDGDGKVEKGLKGEWMTVKGSELIVGGLGKEWTTTEGEYVNDHPMWIKRISPSGAVRHENWKDVFIKIRRAAGIEYPGYMIHEAVQWSDIHKKWFFLPRRMSNEKYTEADDENRGTNVMIIANENFTDFNVVRVGAGEYTSRGFSAFQFIPNTDDQVIIGIKSEEKDGKPVASYASIFTINGRIIVDDVKLNGPHKYEGVAFA
ncbi:unnamed protein product [Caenorhabditis bovis]|uniref:Apyrase n=1 Tax=Caenorhabditis bovis TaxID=2654633 RepID=A0A8S1EHH5_9PELO|nr:unnamed protein product [Caenorhabditis bovis]